MADTQDRGSPATVLDLLHHARFAMAIRLLSFGPW
jgi:hypothetical protein